MIQGHLNLDSLSKFGFTVAQLDSFHADAMLGEVRKRKFALESGENGSDPLSYKQFPEFDKHPEVSPADDLIEGFWLWLSWDNYFSYYRKNFGDFTKIKPLTLKYGEGAGWNWHYDVFDASHLLVIVYLTGDTFKPGDGGSLKIGYTEVDEKGQAVGGVETVSVIPPNHGTVVIIDNRNPTVLHSVTKLNCTKERYSLSCQYGYVENRGPK